MQLSGKCKYVTSKSYQHEYLHKAAFKQTSDITGNMLLTVIASLIIAMSVNSFFAPSLVVPV